MFEYWVPTFPQRPLSPSSNNIESFCQTLCYFLSWSNVYRFSWISNLVGLLPTLTFDVLRFFNLKEMPDLAFFDVEDWRSSDKKKREYIEITKIRTNWILSKFLFLSWAFFKDNFLVPISRWNLSDVSTSSTSGKTSTEKKHREAARERVCVCATRVDRWTET